jgi:hypothetical protein
VQTNFLSISADPLASLVVFFLRLNFYHSMARVLYDVFLNVGMFLELIQDRSKDLRFSRAVTGSGHAYGIHMLKLFGVYNFLHPLKEEVASRLTCDVCVTVRLGQGRIDCELSDL